MSATPEEENRTSVLRLIHEDYKNYMPKDKGTVEITHDVETLDFKMKNRFLCYALFLYFYFVFHIFLVYYVLKTFVVGDINAFEEILALVISGVMVIVWLFGIQARRSMSSGVQAKFLYVLMIYMLGGVALLVLELFTSYRFGIQGHATDPVILLCLFVAAPGWTYQRGSKLLSYYRRRELLVAEGKLAPEVHTETL